jgi:hypothetical protein
MIDRRLAIVVLVLATSCVSAPENYDPFTLPQIDWTPDLIPSNNQADRVLGGPSHLEKTTSYLNGGIPTYQSVYYDDAPDDAGKTGTFYYMLEDFPLADDVTSYLDQTLGDNHVPLDAAVPLTNGGRLYWLTGGPEVRMAMIQKKNILLRLKVNVVTARYNEKEFKKVALEIAEDTRSGALLW